MLTFIILMVTYALAMTWIAVLNIWRNARPDPTHAKVEEWFKKATPTHETVNALSAFKMTQQSSVPWYERSVSAVGVVAFIGMSFATSVQTIQSLHAESEAEALRDEVKALGEQKESAVALIASSVRALSDVLALREEVDPSIRELLQFHLNRALSLKEPAPAFLRDSFNTAISIGEYEIAATLFDRLPSPGDNAKPEERLTLAEGLYLSGWPQKARLHLKEVVPMRSSLSTGSIRRALVLDTVLNPASNHTAEYSALLRISLEDADMTLKRDVARLRLYATEIQAKKRSHLAGGPAR